MENEPMSYVDPAAYTIPEFCTTHKLSRSELYKLWKQGLGPRIKRYGTKVIITGEAAAEFRAQEQAVTA
jgi:hypothetical protein